MVGHLEGFLSSPSFWFSRSEWGTRFAFLTSSYVRLMLTVHKPQVEKHKCHLALAIMIKAESPAQAFSSTKWEGKSQEKPPFSIWPRNFMHHCHSNPLGLLLVKWSWLATKEVWLFCKRLWMDVHESYCNSGVFMKREGRIHFVAWVLPHWERRGPVEALPHCQINLTVTGLAFMAVALRHSHRQTWTHGIWVGPLEGCKADSYHKELLKLPCPK